MAAKLVKVSYSCAFHMDYVTFASVKPETRHDYIYAVPAGTSIVLSDILLMDA